MAANHCHKIATYISTFSDPKLEIPFAAFPPTTFHTQSNDSVFCYCYIIIIISPDQTSDESKVCKHNYYESFIT